MATEKVNKTVLIIDDEPDMSIFISNLLEADGFRPILAKDKTQGLKKATEEHPAVIIIDMMMPEESGVQMYRSLKREEELKHIPVIMLSTISMDTFFKFHIVRGAYSGKKNLDPDTFLEKPPEAEELLNMVRKLSGTGTSDELQDIGRT